VEATADVVDGVVVSVWNGLYHWGFQVVPLWQPASAATDMRANAPRAIELRMFCCPCVTYARQLLQCNRLEHKKGTRSRPTFGRNFHVLYLFLILEEGIVST
jgi:hypothetical protein